MARNTSCMAGAWPRISGEPSSASCSPLWRHAFIHGAADQFDSVIDVEGFGQVFESAALKGRDGTFQIGMGSHDDDRQRRVALLQLLQ